MNPQESINFVNSHVDVVSALLENWREQDENMVTMDSTGRCYIDAMAVINMTALMAEYSDAGLKFDALDAGAVAASWALSFNCLATYAREGVGGLDILKQEYAAVAEGE